MSVFSSISAVAITALVFSATAALAQAGGPDVPSEAKAQGTMQNGSSTTGMSKNDAAHMTNGSGSMTKSGGNGSMMKAPAVSGGNTATGGQAGGHPGQM